MAVGALLIGVALASLMGWLTRLGARLDLSLGGLDCALAVLALGPLAFYAFSLERKKSAPALRSAWAPWVLFSVLHACVQVSGGLLSPLWGAYPLLVLLVVRNAGGWNASALAGAITVLEAYPLWAQVQGTESSGAGGWWPRVLALALPWLGLALGFLSRPGLAVAAPAAHERVPAPAPPQGAATAPVSPPPPLPRLTFPAEGWVEPAALLDGDLLGSLELAFHAHPAWNALSLWWGDSEGVSLRHLRMRQGRPAAAATVLPGQGLLGLALRERKILSVEPLSEGASAGLPYAEPPYQAGVLRVLPLTDEGRLVGLLCCDKQSREGFGPDEAAALDVLARLMVGHAQRAFQIDRLQASGGRTQKLYAAAQALSMGMEREELLARFGGLLQTLVPCDSWALGMREDESAPLERLADGGYRAGDARILSLDGGGALSATLGAAEGAVLFNSRPGAQVPPVFLEGLAGSPRHFLFAPLRLGGRLTGVLKLDREREPFSEEERDVAYIFANQAAVTLEHSRLYALHRLQATTDGLTGLYNHRYFQERLAVEIEAALRTGRPLSLALTDIDFFKKFNDNFGHQEGDVVLRKVADLLKHNVRLGQDVVCRYGGEEFVVILPDCDVVEARQIMDRLRADCSARLSGGKGDQAQPIAMSVGLATYPAAATEQRDLIHAADEALYHAKHTGRNRVCSFLDLQRQGP